MPVQEPPVVQLDLQAGSECTATCDYSARSTITV